MLNATVDEAESARLAEALRSRLHDRVLDTEEQFCCTSGGGCRTSVGRNGFAAGQMSYVGPSYSLRQEGQPVRILIVSMQVGDDEAPVTFGRRREQIEQRVGETFGDRNQHMMGVTTALRVLLGGEPGSDRAGELIGSPQGEVHVLRAYAMANSVLCSNRPGEGREGGPSRTMIENCSRHLRATIEALRPTIIHSQGRAEGAPSTHHAVEAVLNQIRWENEHVASARVGDHDLVWCSLRHPARNWAQLGREYLRTTAAPALKLARELSLG